MICYNCKEELEEEQTVYTVGIGKILDGKLVKAGPDDVWCAHCTHKED